ncbi:chloroplastic [Seminavis robusta]|uniref:Chloroplastic n=1 Tax=Seminavis robusta TaxID=568900 RepID=A0A9N8EXP9_9STRA|nr:chloroplastic [Seminavis robusta]|eukprot:Sro2297_g322430.1 chloroplastic (191) ;mRNA; r:13733-14462
MKFAAAITLFAASASAFSPFSGAKKAAAVATPAFTVETIPGALEPMGIWDPLGFAAKADEKTLKRYREAELTHGRVAMLATIGFLAGEAVPPLFWALLATGIGAAEQKRAEIGWVEPSNVPVDQPGLLRAEYTPGDIGFDPLGLKPEDPEELLVLQNKELQNGRLAMLAAAGFMAQELADGKGIMEHLMN